MRLNLKPLIDRIKLALDYQKDNKFADYGLKSVFIDSKLD